jgi:hypothetical protein
LVPTEATAINGNAQIAANGRGTADARTAHAGGYRAPVKAARVREEFPRTGEPLPADFRDVYRGVLSRAMPIADGRVPGRRDMSAQERRPPMRVWNLAATRVPGGRCKALAR